jgi:hypothetical protein
MKLMAILKHAMIRHGSRILRNVTISSKQNFRKFVKYADPSISFISGVHLVEAKESIVNAPLVNLQSKNTNNAKSEVRCKHLIRDLSPVQIKSWAE